VFRAAFGVVAQRVRFGEMSSWPADVELEAAHRPKRDDHSHHRVSTGKGAGNERLRRRIDG